MKKIVFILLGMVFVSCSSLDNAFKSDESNKSDKEGVISIEQALERLDDFYSAIGENPAFSKSGISRRIKSVETLSCRRSVLTRSGADTLDIDYYVINYEDEQGYAIIGATPDAEPILAVTEEGSLVLEEILDVEPEIPIGDPVPSLFNEELQEEGFIEIETEVGATSFIRNYILSHYMEHEYWSGPSDPPGSNDVLPLLETNWGQGQWGSAGVYNKYCFSIYNNSVNVLAGCTTAATAMVVAYNEKPANMEYRGLQLNYSLMKAQPYAFDLDALSQEHVSVLYGHIYDNMHKTFTLQEGTLIWPTYAEQYLEQLGYRNVYMYQNDIFFDNDMLDATLSSLHNERPVIICAAHGLSGHTWVIDGVVYYTQYMFHCNWGWGGLANGYFSRSLFDPNNGIQYDGNELENDSERYDWRFRLITYIPPVA